MEIADHLMGVTLIIRGQQHASNVKKQEWLYTHFGWKYPHAFHHGQLLIEGSYGNSGEERRNNEIDVLSRVRE